MTASSRPWRIPTAGPCLCPICSGALARSDLFLLSPRTSVQDKLLQQNTNLTDAELDIIRRLQKGENPDENYDPYAPTVEWYTSHEAVMPLSGRAEPKARFVASKWEHKKVSSLRLGPAPLPALPRL